MVGINAGDLGPAPDFGAALDSARHEAVHHAFGVDKTVGGAEAATNNVVGAELRENFADVFSGNQPDLFHAQTLLQSTVLAQIFQVPLVSGHEEIAVRLVSGG